MYDDAAFPRRIACLSTETAEVLYALGRQDRIVGVSGFTVFPPEARRDKPRISGFSSARIDKILAVEPDLVLAFSDLQADIVKNCISAGLAVHVFNHRDVDGIFHMIATLGRLTGAERQASGLTRSLRQTIDEVRAGTATRQLRPKIYFEEWNDPLITGIRWVSELIGIAGGIDIFSEIALQHSASRRIISSERVLEAQPDIIIASWCGKKFNAQQLLRRPGWNSLPAVRDDLVFEIKSAEILSPGISAITRGLPRIVGCVARWRQQHES